jgi:hypothetical protein
MLFIEAKPEDDVELLAIGRVASSEAAAERFESAFVRPIVGQYRLRKIARRA